ncbi:MAG: protein phosphatase 2C domain-containing protein [Corynebacterium sp.]|nr:protein phosphatase 2C domain-containing protein [Corynebacterium sp.]
MLQLKFTAVSDRGLVRGNNEDSAYAGSFMLALADGMGGHAAGEVASQIMISHLQQLDKDPGDNDMLALLGNVAAEANWAIAEHIGKHPETNGMGTTLTAMLFNGEQMAVCHVGDSRGYRLRGGKLEQLTKDDTYVQALVDEGKLDAGDVSSHPQKSLILKAYAGRDVEPTLFTVDVAKGDIYLLCSDGLSDPVTASTIEAAMATGSVEEIAHRLIELALRSGGPDNVTMVLAEVVETKKPQRVSPQVAGAIAGEIPEPTHPNSAASRAAALHKRPQVIEPDVSNAVGAKSVATPPRRGWGLIIGILVAIAVIVAAWVGGRVYLNNNFYVASSADTEEITIHKGADFSLFGRNLNHRYQTACLGKDSALQLVNDTCPRSTVPFTLAALPPSERMAVANLPAGSYEKVQAELTRLSERALPICKDARSKPGVDCREVATDA